jgi:hypothetical protein
MRIVHDFAPLSDFTSDALAKLLRFVRHGFEPEFKQALPDIRIRRRLGDLVLQ